MPSPTRSTLHWWGTLLYVPVLYGLGWLSSRPLALVFPNGALTRWTWLGWWFRCCYCY